MNELITVTEMMVDEENKSPESIASMIVQLAKDIDECKDDLSRIRDRGIFKRMLSNNTRDLAEMMIKQNDTIALFLHIVQTMVIFNLNNAFMLGEIMHEMNKRETAEGVTNNRYMSVAKAYFSESMKTAELLNNRLKQQDASVAELKQQVQEIAATCTSQQSTLKRHQIMNVILAIAIAVLSAAMFYR